MLRITEKISFIIVDTQSVKNTDTSGENEYDGGKKISGIKKHLEVDIRRLPHSIYITTANVTDRTVAIVMFKHKRENLSRVKNVLVDGIYTGKKFEEHFFFKKYHDIFLHHNRFIMYN